MPPASTASAAEIRDHQPGDTGDPEHPAEEDRDRKARQRRHDHGGEAEDRQQDALEQEGLPMLAHRSTHLRLQFVQLVRKGHGSSPAAGTPDRVDLSRGRAPTKSPLSWSASGCGRQRRSLW
jgi:hypothetical protein